MSWRGQAACIGKANLFFPPHGERPETKRRREEKCRSVCSQCPVLEPCRDEIMANPEDWFGMVGGGMTYEERLSDLSYRHRYIRPVPVRAS